MNIRNNKKGFSALLAVLIVLGIVAAIVVGAIVIRNSLVVANIQVDQDWSLVRNQYQRQADLIGNLMNATKGYMNYEKSIFLGVTEARTNWLNARNGSQVAQDEAGSLMNLATGTFLSTVENYPTLTADKVVINFMDEVAGTQNRITQARAIYIKDIGDYNKAVSTIPGSFFGFSTRQFYQGSEGIENPPVVNFP